MAPPFPSAGTTTIATISPITTRGAVGRTASDTTYATRFAITPISTYTGVIIKKRTTRNGNGIKAVDSPALTAITTISTITSITTRASLQQPGMLTPGLLAPVPPFPADPPLPPEPPAPAVLLLNVLLVTISAVWEDTAPPLPP